MINYEELEMDGDVEFTNRVFPGWWGDAEEGEGYIAEYADTGYSPDGEKYIVEYQFDLVKGEEPEPDDLTFDVEHVSRIRYA